jgi:succinate-acetate transporter protein
MAFEELKEHTENIQDEAKAFVESTIAYYKLKGFKLLMKSTTLIVKFTLIFIFFLMVILFCSIAAAIAIGQYLDNYALGFFIVGGIYLGIFILIFLAKEKIVEGPILKKFSEIFFND